MEVPSEASLRSGLSGRQRKAHIGSSSTALERDLRILQAAESDLRALLDNRKIRRPHDVPHLVGMSAAAATCVLEAIGFTALCIDDGSEGRMVMNKDNWFVVRQSFPGSSTSQDVPVKLHVEKFAA